MISAEQQLRTIGTKSSWRGVRVLVRTSLNVPVFDGIVQDMYRLRHATPTIQFLLERQARVIVIGHIGRASDESLAPVHAALQQYLPISWGGDHTTAEAQAKLAGLAPGEATMLENMRRFSGETKNDAGFAAELATLADVYVNDAFANMHRCHASMVGVAELLPAYAGLRVVEEVTALDTARAPKHPSLFILGGAKFETKLSLVDRYIDVYDEVFVGGALAHDVMRARGYEIGRSLASDSALSEVPVIADERLVLPLDVVVRQQDGASRAVAIDGVAPDDTILDCGPKTVAYLKERAAAAKTILWNGPLGNYEAGFTAGTEGVAIAVADSVGASYVGGGDTVAAIQAVGRNNDFTFISTGGGAMLSYLEHGELSALRPLVF